MCSLFSLCILDGDVLTSKIPANSELPLNKLYFNQIFISKHIKLQNTYIQNISYCETYVQNMHQIIYLSADTTMTG